MLWVCFGAMYTCTTCYNVYHLYMASKIIYYANQPRVHLPNLSVIIWGCVCCKISKLTCFNISRNKTGVLLHPGNLPFDFISIAREHSKDFWWRKTLKKALFWLRCFSAEEQNEVHSGMESNWKNTPRKKEGKRSEWYKLLLEHSGTKRMRVWKTGLRGRCWGMTCKKSRAVTTWSWHVLMRLVRWRLTHGQPSIVCLRRQLPPFCISALRLCWRNKLENQNSNIFQGWRNQRALVSKFGNRNWSFNFS